VTSPGLLHAKVNGIQPAEEVAVTFRVRF